MRQSKMSFVAAFALVGVVSLCGCTPGGVLTYEEGTQDGYTFLSLVGAPLYAGVMFEPALIDMQGNEVHRYGVKGPYTKILPGGSAIMGEGSLRQLTQLSFRSVVQEAWDGTTEWSFSASNGPSTSRM